MRAALAEARAASVVALVQSGWGRRAVALAGIAGGRLVLRRGAGRVDVDRYALVSGVALEGTLSVGVDPTAGRLSGAVRVCGMAAARGVLVVVGGGRVRGVLGGRRVGPAGPLPRVRAC